MSETQDPVEPEHMARDEWDAVRQRAKAAVGGFTSGGDTNTSEDHDAVLAEERRW